MTPARTIAALAAVAAIAVPLAGCGEDQSFIDDYNSATKPLQSINSDIGSSLNGASSQSDKKLAAQFQTLADKTAEVNKNLADLDPPSDAEASFNQLKAALKKGQTDLQSVADAVKKGDVDAAQKAVSEIAKDGQAISTAENAVKKKVED